MCIFQLPAITGLRTPCFPMEFGSQLTARSRFHSRQRTPPQQAQPDLPATADVLAGFQRFIHLHFTHLNALLRLPARGDPTLPFQELIQLHRREF